MSLFPFLCLFLGLASWDTLMGHIITQPSSIAQATRPSDGVVLVVDRDGEVR